MATLKIKIGDEYKINFEQGKDFTNSIYLDLYKSSARSVNEILSQSIKDKRDYSDFFKNDDYNNIIAFVGERGTGKSSSMISFAEALINNNVRTKVDGFFDEFRSIKDRRFLSLDVIDPSLFSQKDTLFEIIISKMFLKFQKQLENEHLESDQTKKREIIKSFQEVFKNLKTIHNDKKVLYEQEVIEVLSKLANGTNLRENFHALVKQYLEFFNKKDGVLVLVIDDFDLKISEAYSMLEDIRQFLIQENILILLACKFEQLLDSIQLAIVKEYEKVLPFLSDTPKQKATNYLDKIIPIDHRKTTPRLIINTASNESDSFSTINNASKIEIKFEDKELVFNTSIQSGILELIYRRLNLFIPEPQYKNRLIIPDTIREIVNTISFINFLNRDKIDDFKKYLFSEIDKTYSKKELEFFYDIDQLPAVNLNQFIINWLNQNLLELKPIERNQIAQNYTFGSVLGLLKHLENVTPIIYKKEINLISHIRTFYSIRLHEIILNGEYRDLEQVINYELLSQSQSIFPKENNIYNRDIFEFNGIQWLKQSHRDGIYSNDDIFWLFCFISYYGKKEQTRRRGILIESKANDRTLFNRPGAAVGWATFNCLSFITHLQFTDNVENNLYKFIAISEVPELSIQIKKWEKIDSYHLFFNADFMKEFTDELEKFSKNYKDPLEGYGNTLYIYLTSGINKVLTLLSQKYSYLDIDINDFLENPIFEYWKLNYERINNLLDVIFNFQKSKEDEVNVTSKTRDMARHLLNHYSRYFNESASLGSQGAKMAMNNLINNFKDNNDIHATLKGYRFVMDEDLKRGISEINNYLVLLSNG